MVHIPGKNGDDDALHNNGKNHYRDRFFPVMVILSKQKSANWYGQQYRGEQTNTPHTVLVSGFDNKFIPFAEFFPVLSFIDSFLLPRSYAIQNAVGCIFNYGGF